jgi:hypothetical protein
MKTTQMMKIWNQFRKERTVLRGMRTPEFFTIMEDYYDQPHQQDMMRLEKAFRKIDDIFMRRYPFDPKDQNFHPRRG